MWRYSLLGLLIGGYLCVPVWAAPLVGIEQDAPNNVLRIRTQQPVSFRVDKNSANEVILFLPNTEPGAIPAQQTVEIGDVEVRAVAGGLQLIYKPKALGSTFQVQAAQPTPDTQAIEIRASGGIAQAPTTSTPTTPAPPVSTEERVSLKVRDGDVKDTLTLLGRVARANVVTDNSVTGKVSLNLDNVPFSDALNALVTAGNLTYTKSGDVYVVSQPPKSGLAPLSVTPTPGTPGADAATRSVNLNVKNAELTSVIENISNQAGAQLLIKDQVVGRVTGRFAGIPFEDALNQILAGTRYSYIRQGKVYLIGDATPGTPNSQIFSDVEVVPLAYTDVKKVNTLFPAGFPTQNVKNDPVRNALVVSGSAAVRARVKKFIQEIDRPVKQVVFEVKVVELPETVSRELNPLRAFIPSVSAAPTNPTTGTPTTPTAPTTTTVTSAAGQLALDASAGLGTLNLYNNVARLFQVVSGLITESRAKLVTDTKLTTFSGNKASINVSQDINLTLSQNTALNGIATQNTNLQTLRAGTILELEPVVQADGNVMAKLKIESSTPGTRASSNVAPDIFRRTVDNMLLMRDGETYEIGGLIQNNVTETVRRIPILGYIPLLGQLFTDTAVSVTQTELMVFITPRIRDVQLDTSARIVRPDAAPAR